MTSSIVFPFNLFVCFHFLSAFAYDSLPAAITVYRNPDFFNTIPYYESGENHYDGNGSPFSFYGRTDYKYPGEPTKPNPPAPRDFHVSYDTGPEFHHDPRNVHRNPTPPKRGRGPYGHPRYYHEEQDEPPEDRRQYDDSRYQSDEDEEGEETNEDVRSDSEDDYSEEQEEESDEINEEEEEDEDGPRAEDTNGSRSYSDTFEKNYKSRPEDDIHEEEPEKIIDKKKGTREYYRHHAQPEGDDPPESSQLINVRDNTKTKANTKLVFQKLYIPRKVTPVLLLNYPAKPKLKKYKLKYNPAYVQLVRRSDLPSNEKYQINSDFDLDYESLNKAKVL